MFQRFVLVSFVYSLLLVFFKFRQHHIRILRTHRLGLREFESARARFKFLVNFTVCHSGYQAKHEWTKHRIRRRRRKRGEKTTQQLIDDILGIPRCMSSRWQGCCVLRVAFFGVRLWIWSSSLSPSRTHFVACLCTHLMPLCNFHSKFTWNSFNYRM